MSDLRFGFGVDDRILVRLLADAPGKLFRGVQRLTGKLVRRVEGRVVRERFGPQTTATTLKSRSGHLAASMFHRVEGTDLESLEGIVGNHAIYAPTHEDGRPAGRPPGATGQFAAIPLPAALTPAGVLIAPPREWPDTFFRRSKLGRLILWQSRGELNFPLFLMKSWDQMGPIPPRLGILVTMQEELPRFNAALAKELVKILGGL